jgi:chemotaxis signal transduction protein
MNKNENKDIQYASDFMPADDVSLKILHERASILGKIKAKEDDAVNEIHYIKFKLGHHEKYGILYETVKEVVQNISITPLPGKQDYILGVINRRSGLIVVIDVKKLLQIDNGDLSTKKYIIVVSDGELSIGIAVDELTGSDQCDINKIQTSVYEGVVNANFIIGLDETNATILNAKTILQMLKNKLSDKTNN